MKRLLPVLLCFALFPVFYIQAQEEAEETTVNGIVDSNDLDDSDSSEASYIEMDIRTSSLMELAAWCRELGLSEGGTREELAARLRSHYGLPSVQGTDLGEERIITIESANTTEYFTIEVVDEEYARLRGDVIISLREDNAVHRIKAWEILYNRTRNVLTA